MTAQLLFKGRVYSCLDFADLTGISHQVVSRLARKGMSTDDIINFQLNKLQRRLSHERQGS